MGQFYSPRIVTDGLVLALDAANSKSYSGTGTTWFDLSGNNNHGNLVNNTEFTSTSFGKAFLGDMVNSYIRIDKTPSLDFTPLDSFTMNICGYLSDITQWDKEADSQDRELNTNTTFFGRGSTSQSVGIGGARNYEGTSYSYVWGSRAINQISLPSISFNVNENIPINLTYIYTPTIQFGYMNGELYHSNSTEAGNTGTFQDTFYAIFVNRAVPGGNGRYPSGAVFCASIYNRALTSDEVFQNYNATKSRYGI